MTCDINSDRLVQKKQRSTFVRVLSVSGVTLAGALAIGSAQAQSNDQCETNVLGDECDVFELDPISVTPFFTPPDERHQVPYYQPDDPRDLIRLDDGGGSASTSPGDDPEEDDMCTSSTTVTDLITLAETIDYNESDDSFANWVAGVAGVVTGGVTATVLSVYDDMTSGIIGGTVGVTVSSWLSDALTRDAVHCGDRILIKTTVCLTPSVVLAASAAPVTVQSVDTRTEHLHSRCDVFGIAPTSVPSGVQAQNNSSSSSRLQFELTLNGVTHAFEERPSGQEIKEIIDNIQNPRSSTLSPADLDRKAAMDAFERGVEAGIRAYEEYYGSTDDSKKG